MDYGVCRKTDGLLAFELKGNVECNYDRFDSPL